MSEAIEEDVVIYYNDCIDSDNMVAAMALRRAMQHAPSTRVVWVLEPRQVSLGLAMTPEQTDACKNLIKAHFPERGNPFKVLLGGLLEPADVESIQGISDSDRQTLRLAVKPKYGPKEDAVRHGRLAAWDLAACLSNWTSTPVDVLMDAESLDKVDNPVNLNIHHHEELVARSEDELKRYETIMTEPLQQRTESLREWYAGCVDRASNLDDCKGCSVQDLDFDSLCDTVKAAKSVRFLGGSSLWILQRLLEKGLAHKIQCCLQVGSCDLSMNLFPNQFNIALNQKAAKYVLERTSEFAKFTVVPSHTAQNIKYSILGLQQKTGRHLEAKILGFNCREDPLKIATNQVTISKDYSNKEFPMPDLTAFLCALLPEHVAPTAGFVQLEESDGVLIFRPGSSGIPMHDLQDVKSYDEAKVGAVFEALAAGNKWLDLG